MNMQNKYNIQTIKFTPNKHFLFAELRFETPEKNEAIASKFQSY